MAAALAAGRASLGEWEAKRLLAAYGVRVPAGGLVFSEREALDLAASLGGPVALKAVGHAVRHKTEAGLVLLGLDGPVQVADGYRTLRERAGEMLEGVLVEEMLAGPREFMTGMKRDDAFGTVVAFGLGGVLTEALGDIALAVAPLDERDVFELFGSIRAARLLESFRGQPPVDREELAAVVMALARIAADHPHVSEVDINPLLLSGGHPVAADALVVLSSQPAAEPPARRAFTPDLATVCAPRSVAIVGASDDIAKWGGSALKNILDGGFAGTVYPVSPKGGSFFGLPVSRSVEELPEAPDMALIAVGPRLVPTIVEQCGRCGVPSVVVIAAGYSETGEAGAAAERALAETASADGVTLIGPNCMGVSPTRLICMPPASSTCIRRGHLSVVSQSGNLGVALSSSDCVGLDKLSVGNEAQAVADAPDQRADAHPLRSCT